MGNNLLMKRVVLLCLFIGFALLGYSQSNDQTIYKYTVRYTGELNVLLFYRDGKPMLKVADPHQNRRLSFARRKYADGTVEPIPDTLRGTARNFIDREVFVDDTVALRVKEMIKSLRLSKMKERYERVYKKGEIMETGGSFWNLMFLKPDGSYGQSGGRFLLNRKKAQKNLDKYMTRLRMINDYLLNVDVKYCPTLKDYQ